MERSMKKQNGLGRQQKRGRKPKRDIRAKAGLVAEVKAEFAAIDPEHKLSKPPVEQAVENCLRHDATTQPRSWWWMEHSPLGLHSAIALYYKAAADLEKHGPLEPFLPLSELAKRCGIESLATPPTPTLDGVIEEMLGDRWLSEQKQLPRAMSQAYWRDLHREHLGFIGFLKRTANDNRIKLATDARLHSAAKVQSVRDVLGSLEAQIADFEARVAKLEAPNQNFATQQVARFARKSAHQR